MVPKVHREWHHLEMWLIGGNVSPGACFEVSEAQARARGALSLLLVNLDVKFSGTSLAPCLPAWCRGPALKIMD